MGVQVVHCTVLRALFSLQSWGPHCPGAPLALSSVHRPLAGPAIPPAQGSAGMPRLEGEATSTVQLPGCCLRSVGLSLPRAPRAVWDGGVISWSAGAQNLMRSPSQLWGPKVLGILLLGGAVSGEGQSGV